MSRLAIHVHELSKQYRIGRLLNGYSTLRETLTESLVRPMRWAGQLLQRRQARDQDNPEELLWALRDVSFDVKPGEVVGIIGRNGAGKSTLLKILSQITEPSEGFADIYGRVASLLEVGTGFHPELTGRENLYLNGAILGMRRTEIDRKFDEIVSFAEVERFVDTPVKHYSSGMHLRLAFAVAAHLEPEILLVDEVLAVGDARFQKKCLGKMDDVAKQGRTILFVSHSMTAVQTLCSRAIWIDQGQIVEEGRADQVSINYLKASTSTLTQRTWDDISAAPGNGTIRFRRISVRPEQTAASDPISDQITVATPFVMEFEYWNLEPDAYLNLSLVLYNEHGFVVFNTGPGNERVWHGRPFPRGLFHSACHVPGNLLNDGPYRVLLLVVKNQRHIVYRQEDALCFEIADVSRTGSTWYGKFPGVVRPDLKWVTHLVQVGEPAALAASKTG